MKNEKLKCNGPNCACSHHSMEEIMQWQTDMIAKHGFYIHYTPGENLSLCNFHTHGILENLLHPDFQIVVPISPKAAYNIIWTLVDMVKEGHRFNAGDKVDKVIQNFPITFIVAEECERELLRLILPDKKGNLSKEDIEGAFTLQYSKLK